MNLYLYRFVHFRHLKKCLTDYGTADYCEWVLKHPGQAVLTVVSSSICVLQTYQNMSICSLLVF